MDSEESGDGRAVPPQRDPIPPSIPLLLRLGHLAGWPLYLLSMGNFVAFHVQGSHEGQVAVCMCTVQQVNVYDETVAPTESQVCDWLTHATTSLLEVR